MQIPVRKSDHNFFESDRVPVLLYAGQITNNPDFVFHAHKHDDLSEIIYIKEGEGFYVIDDKQYSAGKGDILIFNKGVLHEEKTNTEKPLEFYFCGVGNLFIRGAEPGCITPSNVSPIIHTNNYAYKAEKYISNIFEECLSQVIGYDIVSQNLLISLIVLILRIINATEGESGAVKKDTLGYKVKEYIDKNYTKDISLQDIADTLYISQDYISHIFKNEIGNSPINYLITRRIGEAKRLLLTTDKTVQEIAFSVGYENANYFTMIFKKLTGSSPGMFRKNNLKKV